MTDLRAYIESLVRFAGVRRLVSLGLLSLVTASSDGLGFFLLVPILETLAAQGGSRSAIARSIVALGIPPTLHALLFAFVVVISVRALLIHARQIATNRLVLEFVDDTRARLLGSVAQASWPFLVRRRMSDVGKAFALDVMSISAGTSMLLQLTSVAFLLAVQASVALRLAPLLALGTLVPAALLAFALRGQIRRILELGRAANSSHEAVFHEMSEFLGGMKLAKSAAAEGPHVAACVSAAARLRAQQLHYIRAKSGAHMAYQIGGALAMVLLVVLGSTVSELPLPELLVLGAVFSRMVPVVLDCVSQIQAVAHSLPAFASVESIIRECQSAAEEEDAGRPAPTLGAELALHGVSFRYEPAGPDVLRDVSLTIRAGGMLAVTGPSGAGKSTLADLVMGLLHPTQGLLTIDGAPLLRAEARAWRRSLAYVSQESFLFRDSVRANLLWARPDATEKDLWHALSLAAAAGFVTALPRGLDTMIGDRGLLLSGGERQRLAIARAVLRRPQLLVLDEATSALDYENERLVQAAIDGLRGLTTILVITHRLMALRGADEVLVLVEGRTAERGEWQSLVEGGGWLATTLGPGESRLAPTYPP